MAQINIDSQAQQKLPKGMVIPEQEEPKRISQQTRNYSGEILEALSKIDGLVVTCVHMEVVEDEGSNPVVSLVLTVDEE